MKRILIVVFAIALFLGAVGVWYTQNQSTVVQAETKREAVPVQAGDIVNSIKATGNLEAKDEIELSFEMNGIVEDVYVKRGQQVEAGELHVAGAHVVRRVALPGHPRQHALQ